MVKVEYLYAPNVVSCRPSDPLASATQVLTRVGVGALPVMRADGTLVGIISARDLVRALARQRDSSSSIVAA